MVRHTRRPIMRRPHEPSGVPDCRQGERGGENGLVVLRANEPVELSVLTHQERHKIAMQLTECAR